MRFRTPLSALLPLLVLLVLVPHPASFSSVTQAQPTVDFSSKTWARSYHTLLGDSPSAVEQLPDQGFVVAGRTQTSPSGAFVMRLNPIGGILWERVYGGYSANRIRQTSDGGFIVGGSTDFVSDPGSTNSGPTNVWLLRLDSQGSVLWQKTYDRPGPDQIVALFQSGDGGFVSVVGGNFPANKWAFKVDSQGNLLWLKTFQLPVSLPGSAWLTSDDGLIIVGAPDPGTPYALRLDSSGSFVWLKIYNGSPCNSLNSVQQTSSGGFIMAGGTENGSGACIFLLDSTGNIVWQRMYANGIICCATMVREANTGGFLLATATLSFGAGGVDILLMRLDSLGNIMWQRTYGKTGNDHTSWVEPTTNNGFVVSADSNSGTAYFQAWIIKLDYSGFVGCQCPIIGTSGITSSPVAMVANATTPVLTDSDGVVADTSAVPVSAAFGNTLLCNYLVGDLDGDSDVDILDIAAIGFAFDSTPSSSRWNPKADVNLDGKVDILDVAAATLNYGRICYRP